MDSVHVQQEPEAEDEADGWDIVQPTASGNQKAWWAAKRDGPHAESATLLAVDEVPDDLIMGCLHRECNAHFHEGCTRHRCACCRLTFCDRHVSRVVVAHPHSFPHGNSGAGLAGSSPPPAHHPAAWAGQPPPGASSASVLAELLGVPSGHESALLCVRCRAAFFPEGAQQQASAATAAGQPAIALGPAGGKKVAGPREDVVDSPAVLAEAAILRQGPLSALGAEDGEPVARRVARKLVTRLLVRLKSVQRPWTDHEREWLWRLREELCENDPAWVPRFCRQARWDNADEAIRAAQIVDRAHSRSSLSGRDAVQVLCALGRNAVHAVASLGERRLGLAATQVAAALRNLAEKELACSLDLLLDSAYALGAAGAVGGRRAIVGTLTEKALPSTAAAEALRGELFWALEAKSKSSNNARWTDALGVVPPGGSGVGGWAWTSVAAEELLRSLPPEEEHALMRQRCWVRHLERSEFDAARVEPWGESRAFPLAVWPPHRRCLGMEGRPREKNSKNAPVIVKCRWRRAATAGGQPGDEAPGASQEGAPEGAAAAAEGEGDEPENGVPLGNPVSRGPSGEPSGAQSAAAPSDKDEGVTGLVLKRDVGMHLEHQVSQTMRMLEVLIWEDTYLRSLLEREGLKPEDVSVTYIIAMTGPGTALVEFVEGAKTLRDVREESRSGKAGLCERFMSQENGTLISHLRQYNNNKDLPLALLRLAFTSAVSAVLSFVTGLGDRHHENFMATTDGRLLHIDYGYALGREPFDSVLIHALSGGRPPTLLQYEELMEALGPGLLKRVFWPTVRRAYVRVHRSAGLVSEFVFSALARDASHWGGDQVASQRAWSTAQGFVARRCAPSMADQSAEQFVEMLLRHCARNEEGARRRDALKGLCLRERAAQGIGRVYGAVVHTGMGASSAVGLATQSAVDGAAPVLLRGGQEATSAARTAAAGLLGGVRGLLADATRGARGEDAPEE